MTWTPERLKALRRAFGNETQQQFADRIGVSKATVAFWEIGRSIPLLACKFLDRLEKEAAAENQGQLQRV